MDFDCLPAFEFLFLYKTINAIFKYFFLLFNFSKITTIIIKIIKYHELKKKQKNIQIDIFFVLKFFSLTTNLDKIDCNTITLLVSLVQITLKKTTI